MTGFRVRGEREIHGCMKSAAVAAKRRAKRQRQHQFVLAQDGTVLRRVRGDAVARAARDAAEAAQAIDKSHARKVRKARKREARKAGASK